ncbi:MAG: hypothetical protein HQL57_01660 [Magnetococcales bacterium]|nr:hypothetical protein [Magnetococcales bacterium]
MVILRLVLSLSESYPLSVPLETEGNFVFHVLVEMRYHARWPGVRWGILV